jgi:hypothetical protein
MGKDEGVIVRVFPARNVHHIAQPAANCNTNPESAAQARTAFAARLAQATKGN